MTKKLVCIIFGLICVICSSSSFVYAHHETLPAPEREYLKQISLNPFKDDLITQDNYNFFITVSEPAPHTYDLYFYIESALFKRAVFADKEVTIYPEYSGRPAEPEQFVLTSDLTGASCLRYIADQPFRAKVRIAAVTTDNKPLAAEAEIQIGSTPPSWWFFILAGLVLAAGIISVYSFRTKK